MPKIKRQFFHCDLLEEAEMWCFVGKEKGKQLSKDAAVLMRDPEAFRGSMLSALKEWPYSCAQNLSATTSNRLAWLGHAGCFLATRSPEANTRNGWRQLTEEEQMEANKEAEKVIEEWENTKAIILR